MEKIRINDFVDKRYPHADSDFRDQKKEKLISIFCDHQKQHKTEQEQQDKEAMSWID